MGCETGQQEVRHRKRWTRIAAHVGPLNLSRAPWLAKGDGGSVTVFKKALGSLLA